MIINRILVASNPFFDAYIHSDFLGRVIILGLIILSICSWVILVQKTFWTHRARKHSNKFYEIFQHHKLNPLNLDVPTSLQETYVNPFLDIYCVLKKHTLDILHKNRRFGQPKEEGEQDQHSYLSPPDIDFVEAHLISTVSHQTKFLEKNLFILSTIVSLAPFLGLLGTVWGILTTFSDMQTHTAGNTHQMVLGGLSLALATTVLGLIDAIPALIGYNYLKNTIKDFQTEMEGFSNEILASVELQYRKVTLH